jgi:hypothetical protein
MVGHGLGVGLKTTMRKNDNIRRAKYMFHKWTYSELHVS